MEDAIRLAYRGSEITVRAVPHKDTSDNQRNLFVPHALVVVGTDTSGRPDQRQIPMTEETAFIDRDDCMDYARKEAKAYIDQMLDPDRG